MSGHSSLDDGARFMMDPAAQTDVHMMTGNTLSLIANRISYVAGIHGPSCRGHGLLVSRLCAQPGSRSDQPREIDTAIVGAVNLLLSPILFCRILSSVDAFAHRPMPAV